MNPKEDQPRVGEAPIRDEETVAGGYEPPAITVLGSVEELTAALPVPSL